ncbi:MAG: hypothetical protein R6X22_10740 [Gemmatimonadota bacterium]
MEREAEISTGGGLTGRGFGEMGLAGFSDGASCALSLGLSSGDLFPRFVGHSAGFLAPGEPIVGMPRIWMSHGTGDAVFPVSAGRQVELRPLNDGYDLAFTEFDGGHAIPPAIAGAALDWLPARDRDGMRA